MCRCYKEIDLWNFTAGFGAGMLKGLLWFIVLLAKEEKDKMDLLFCRRQMFTEVESAPLKACLQSYCNISSVHPVPHRRKWEQVANYGTPTLVTYSQCSVPLTCITLSYCQSFGFQRAGECWVPALPVTQQKLCSGPCVLGNWGS